MRRGGAVDLRALRAGRPAEIGALRDRRPHRRHLAAALVDLAARGHLVVEDAGNDPEIGEALDWFLLPAPAADARADPDGDGALARHEQRLLDLVAAAPDGLLSRVRSSTGVGAVLDAVRDDVVARGWRRGGRWGRRTPDGRAVLAEVEAARAALARERPEPGVTAALLPQAVALGLGDLWAARLGQQRPPAPTWFHPGPSAPARGWRGVIALVGAASVPPPPGGGAGAAIGTGGPGGW